MDWTEYFDHIYCIHYLPDKHKLPRLTAELSRVGILGSGIFEFRYTTPSPYDNIIWEKEKGGLAPKPAFVNICLEVRKCLAEALAFGYKRILLLEHDVCFLKDLEELDKGFAQTPVGFGVVQYDKFVNEQTVEDYKKRLSEKMVNDLYFDGSGGFYSSAACMGLFDTGISEMLRVMDEQICATDIAPQLMECRYAVASRNLAIQLFYAESISVDQYGADFMHEVYRNAGIDYNDYAVPDGYGYGKVVGMEDTDNFRVSVYAIALNEERLIRRWYNCFKAADEVVVLDTGSTDRTVEILQSLGAKVKTAKFEKWKSLEELDAIVARGGRPWRFDDARNQAMNLCDQSSTLLFCSDIDDVVEPGWKERLRIAWQKGCEEGAKTGHKPNAVLYTYSVVYQKDGREIEQEFVRHGIHVPGKWRWHSRCHEYLEIEDGPKNFVHFPEFKMKSRPEVKNHSSYLVMLEADARDGSPDGRAYHLLGREYMQHRRADEALAMFHKYLSCRGATWKNERAATMKFISDCYSLKRDEARQELWLWKAMNEDPTDRDAPYVLGRMLIKHKEFSTAVSVLEKCIAIKKPNHDFPMFSLEAWTEHPYLSLAEAYFYNGQLPQALTAAKMALENNPDSRMAQITVKEIEDALANAKENIISKPCFRIELPK